VIAKAVGFDDQSQLGPEEVHLEAIDARASVRRWEARPPGNRQKAPLQLGVGENEGVPVKQLPQRHNSVTAGEPTERRAKRLGIDKAELVSLVDRSLELIGGQASGKVD
jgi:hypothetical protein